MADFIIEQIGISLEPEILAGLALLLKEGGVDAGTFFIGPITAAPELLRLVWYALGEAPASIVIDRAALVDTDGVHTAAQAFLKMWRGRLPL